jgi:uncharacterized protein YjbI with pentapeptide repeats
MGWKQWNMVSQYVLGIEKWNQIFHDGSYSNYRISGRTIDGLKNLSISDQEITDIENQIGVEIKDLCKANRPLISFKEMHFPGDFSLSSSVIPFDIDFSESHFEGNVFMGANLFLANLDISDCTFEQDFSIDSSNIKGSLLSSSVKIKGKSDFSFLKIAENTNFENSLYLNLVDFSCTTFSGEVRFDSVTFHKEARFIATTFNFEPNKIYYIDDRAAEYPPDSTIEEMTPSFIGAKFMTIADFSGAKFLSVPHFEGAQVDAIFFHDCLGRKYQDDCHFNIKHNKYKTPQMAKSAWLALLRLMEKIHDFNRMQEFHLKLLEVEKEESASQIHDLSGEPWYNLKAQFRKSHYNLKKVLTLCLYCGFEKLGSGRDFLTPMLSCIVLAVISYVLYSLCFVLTLQLDLSSLKKAIQTLMGGLEHFPSIPILATTVSNAVPFMDFNFDENVFKNKIFMFHFFWYLISVIQKTLSILCFFLTALAVRNRFRIRS